MSILPLNKIVREHSRGSRLCILLSLAVLAFVVTAISPPQVTDDAYITYRYVRNIVTGQGFVYNTGERVLGTTTPLYTLLLAAVTYALPRGDIIQLSLTVNAISDALSTIVLFQLACWITRSKWNSLIIALAFALHPQRIVVARSGMETPVYVLLLLASSYWYISKRPYLSAAICSLAILARPEGLLLACLLFSHLLVARKKTPFRELAVLFGILLPWLAFSTLYFGSPMPNSMLAKARAYLTATDLEALLVILRAWGSFWPHERGFGWRVIYSFANAIFLSSIYGFVALRQLKRDSSVVVFFGYPLLFTLVFAWANPTMVFWYLVPLLPYWLVGLVEGISTFANLILGSSRRRFALPAVLAILAMSQLLAIDVFRTAQASKEIPRELLYQQLALELDQQMVDSTLAASEIGVLGYYSSAYILDTVGLVSPQAIPYYPAKRVSDEWSGNYAIPTELILDHEPDYLLSLEVFMRHTLLQSQSFMQQYSLIEKVECSTFGSDGILVFRRKEHNISEVE